LGAGQNPVHTYIDAGEYDVSLQVIDANGCENSLTLINVIEVFPLPVAFFTTTPQQVSVLNPVVQFSNGSSGATSVLWDLGDGTFPINDWSPKHTYSDTGRYQIELIAVSNEGCRDTFYNEIIVKGETTFWIPNGFSPNNDGINETFTGYGIGIREALFYIFDRWGKQIYESNSLDKGWDGSFGNSGDPCPEGVYVYLFKVYNLLEDLPKEYSGRVTLLR
jgi:gliding motility-associated-like protein